MLSKERDELASVLQLMDGLADQWGDEAVFRRCRDRIRSLLTQPEPLVWKEDRFGSHVATMGKHVIKIHHGILTTVSVSEHEGNQHIRWIVELLLFPSLESAKAACEALRPFLEQIGGGKQ